MLHITNGDSAAAGIRASGVPGVVLPWRDVLVEGPVPGNVSDEELRVIRATFLADQGWATYEEALADQVARDDTLARLGAGDEVTLWFEHDLHDQLQLVQILDRLARRGNAGARVSLICVNRFPGVEPFYGLGQLAPAQLATLWDSRRPISREQLDLARAGWAAFRAPDPGRLFMLAQAGARALPFLSAALIRLLQEYPDMASGLSRTEWEILRSVEGGALRPHDVMQSVSALEEAPFRGDSGLWLQMRSIGACPTPLLRQVDGRLFISPAAYPPSDDFLAQTLTLTDAGRQALAGAIDHVALNGVDRWIGGVRLAGHTVRWRWDPATNALTAGATGESAKN